MADILLAEAGLAEMLRTDLRRICGEHSTSSARSQQRSIGLSEIGDPCDRAVGYKLWQMAPVNVGRDNHLADVGTAWHAWLAAAFAAENERLGRQRYLIEERVWLHTDGYGGTCDLLDIDTGTVVDHKLLGVTSMRKVRSGEVPPRYRTQLHSYGYGHAREGRDVRWVALACYPRSDNLAGDFGGLGLYLHVEPYDEIVAMDGMQRLSRINLLLVSLEVDQHPDRWSLVAATPSDACRWCPYFRPGHGSADADGCPGQPIDAPTTMPGLI